MSTQGRLNTGGGDGSYVVDTITEPFPNPYRVSTFLGGFDFLPDGRAAVCTFHGDVWIVSGIDEKLEKLTWKRFATGLFQPLGLKVVKGDIYVAGRDQITRLKDLNKDGEADLYGAVVAAGVTVLSIAHRPALKKFHQRVVHFDGVRGAKGDKGWHVEEVKK